VAHYPASNFRWQFCLKSIIVKCPFIKDNSSGLFQKPSGSSVFKISKRIDFWAFKEGTQKLEYDPFFSHNIAHFTGPPFMLYNQPYRVFLGLALG